VTPASRAGEAGLDDAAALAAADPAGMLLAAATSAAQVREAASETATVGLAGLVADGRPRAVVTLGMGGSGIAGDVLAGIAGLSCPVPVVAHRGPGLPGWVGAVDLVLAVSCSGSTEETLSALEEAVRRGCRVLAVGAAGSPLADLCARAGGVLVPAAQGRQPRASLWSLATPLLLAADALGLLAFPPAAVEATAVRLEQVAVACRPGADSFTNPAKTLAVDLYGGIPVVWGTSPLTGVAAYRMACQLNENAKAPCTWGVLPEAAHNQVVALDGPHGARRGAGSTAAGSTGAGTAGDGTAGEEAADDFFRDRTQDDEGMPLRLVLLRDAAEEEHPLAARRADLAVELARARRVEVVELRAEGASRAERLASLVGLVDFASVYLGILHGVDPTPVQVITELKSRLR